MLNTHIEGGCGGYVGDIVKLSKLKEGGGGGKIGGGEMARKRTFSARLKQPSERF